MSARRGRPGRLIWHAADVGLGRTYGHAPGDEELNCVRFTLATLRAAFPSAPWTRDAERDLLISHGDAGRPFSPLDAVEALEVGRRVVAPMPGFWHLVQSWRRLTDGRIPPADGRVNGHAWLWYAVDEEAGWILEATSGTSDWLRPSRWADRCATYPAGVRLAELQPAASVPWKAS